MGLAIAGSAAFFMYRKIYYKHEGIIYDIRPRTAIRVADSVQYSDQTPDATRRMWDFGDGEFSADRSGTHTYLNPGSYRLALTVYGAFGALRGEETVNVLSSGIKTEGPGILGAETAMAGSSVMFAAGAPAQSYEWRVEGEAGQVQKSSNATYIFRTPGKRTLVLTTRQPDARYQKEIIVTEATTSAKPTVSHKDYKPNRVHRSPADHLPDIPDLSKGVTVPKDDH